MEVNERIIGGRSQEAGHVCLVTVVMMILSSCILAVSMLKVFCARLFLTFSRTKVIV